MKRKPAIILLAVILLAGIAGGAWWQNASRVRTQVSGILPSAPASEALPAAWQTQWREASARAGSLISAKQGLRDLSRLYHANGLLSEAMQCYRGLEQLEPNEPRWFHLHALIISGYGEIDPALALWRRAIQLAPTYVPAQLRLGEALLKTNQAHQAEATYAAVLKIEPQNPYALLGLARLDLEASRWEEARQRLEQVVSLTNYNLGYDLIVSLYERLGLTQRATAIRARAKASGAYRDPPDPWFDSLIEDCYDVYRLAINAGVLARSGDPATAIHLLQRAAEIAPEDVSVLFQLGTLLATQGDLAGAIGLVRRCTELAPDFSDGWAHLSALQARLGEATTAERTLAEGLRQCPESPGLHLQYARNLQQAGRLGEAVAEFEASIRYRPNEADAYVELGNLYIRQGRNAEGVAQMERALAAEPGHPVALGVLAFSAILSGDESEARRWLNAVNRQPRSPAEQTARLVNAFREKFGRAP